MTENATFTLLQTLPEPLKTDFFPLFLKKVAKRFGSFAKKLYLCTRFREGNLARVLADAV